MMQIEFFCVGTQCARLTLLASVVLCCEAVWLAPVTGQQPLSWQPRTALPSSIETTRDDGLSDENRDRVEAYLDRLMEQRLEARNARWLQGLALSGAERQAWIEQQQIAIRYVLGDRDEIVDHARLSLSHELGATSVVAQGTLGRAIAVRWSVFDDVQAWGILLEPQGEPLADVLLVGAANETVQQIASLSEQNPSASVARRLLARGCRVLIPQTVSLGNEASGSSQVRRLNTSHREFLWRLSFFVGRHPWGYELATHRAAMRALRSTSSPNRPVGLVGFAEGGDAVLHLAALDSRVDAVWMAGSFASRDRAFEEPIDRCVYDSVNRFGAAELASLISSATVLIEASDRPDVIPPAPLEGRNDAGTGELHTLSLVSVQEEFVRLQQLCAASEQADDRHERLQLIAIEEGQGSWGSDDAIDSFCRSLGIDVQASSGQGDWAVLRECDCVQEQVAWVQQWIEHSSRLARESRAKREEFWRQADATSIESWTRSTEVYRDQLRESVIGRLPPPHGELNLRSAWVERGAGWSSYETVMDVGDGMIMMGVVVVPDEAMQAWERAIETGVRPDRLWPVVVMQHGRNGRPYLLCQSDALQDSYHAVGARLAERGYIVFAPQHLYLGEEAYRVVQRKCFALGMTMFAPMVRQHERLLEWLQELPVVDRERIAFYGKSYGGKSAMLIPAVLEGYTTSICSADFNEQVWKHTGLDHAFCFPFTLEYEHTEFDFAERFNYSEIAGLIAPRRFMVERGHDDGVALDSWVAYEYAPVRRLYRRLGIPERTRIEFFEGGHEIHGVGTFEFLDSQ